MAGIGKKKKCKYGFIAQSKPNEIIQNHQKLISSAKEIGVFCGNSCDVVQKSTDAQKDETINTWGKEKISIENMYNKICKKSLSKKNMKNWLFEREDILFIKAWFRGSVTHFFQFLGFEYQKNSLDIFSFLHANVNMNG